MKEMVPGIHLPLPRAKPSVFRIWAPFHCLFQGTGKVTAPACTRVLLKSQIKYSDDRANLSFLPSCPPLHFFYMTNEGGCWNTDKEPPALWIPCHTASHFSNPVTFCKTFSASGLFNPSFLWGSCVRTRMIFLTEHPNPSLNPFSSHSFTQQTIAK